ncbi:MAG: hypothetical protein J3K34DRAFT_418255 [Monoraphidium minutum]|nr:MAG: hypothetical protein J3K34DRAFT_418255 [Monoraphidium minutum]
MSVGVLVLWTVAVAGWTGFQVVQNALWYQHIKGLNLGSVPYEGQVGTPHQAGVAREEEALWIILAVEAAMTIIFPVLAVALLWLPYIHSCRGGARSRRTKRSFVPWFCTLLLVCAAWFKLFAIISLINKMHAHKVWCTVGENLDLQYTFNPSAQPELADCRQVWFASGIRQSIIFAVATICFHMLMYFGHQPFSTLGKAYGILPTILIVALLLLKPLTALMNWYYTQGHFTELLNFTFTSEMIVALISFITAIWLSVYMGWAIHSVRLIPRFTNTLLACCCGRRYEDVYYEHERAKGNDTRGGGPGSYSLRAAIRSMIQQWFYMVQLPAVFGFVSPMITFASLREQNWWIKADIIVGAVMLFVYMVACAFHRQLLAPPKAERVIVPARH